MDIVFAGLDWKRLFRRDAETSTQDARATQLQNSVFRDERLAEMSVRAALLLAIRLIL